jgi:SanA protein
MSRWRWLPVITGGMMGLSLLLTAFAYLDVSYHYRGNIVTPAEIEEPAVVLVLGAGIYPSGQLSVVLKDRMLTAIDLYREGKARRLLLSGDNRFVDYDEPGRMADFARSQGVPEAVLAYDYAGRRTYDSCYRARHIFGQRRLIIVTQAFHLPRALYPLLP